MPHPTLALLGSLSLLQVVFLPGYLLLRILRPPGGFVSKAAFCFGLSLLANYCMVAALTTVKFYRPTVVYAIFALESALWLRLDSRLWAARLATVWAEVRWRAEALFSDFSSGCLLRSSWLRRLMTASALAAIAGFAAASLAQTGQIFQQWDAVVSWNRWAVDWAADRLPAMTSYYPQLLPANSSLTYVFMQSCAVWTFAKGIQFLFCLFILLTMIDAGRRTKQFGLMPGVAITYWLFVSLLRYRMLASGYADVPLAFFGWMSVYALFLAERAADDAQRTRCLIAGALMAAGAAVTKQMGLYFAALYPLLALKSSGWRISMLATGVKRELPHHSQAQGRATHGQSSPHRVPLLLCLLLALLVAPWYVYKFVEIRSGGDYDNMHELLTDFHEGRTPPQRIEHAVAQVLDATTVPGGVLLLLAVAAAVPLPGPRRWLLLFAFPLGLAWAVGFSYDLRNLAPIIPFLGAAAGCGAVQICRWIESLVLGPHEAPPPPTRGESHSKRRLDGVPLIEFCRNLRIGPLAALALAACFATAICISDSRLLGNQQRQQRMAGVPALNRRLYAFAAAHPAESLIATDYLPLPWLPDLSQRSLLSRRIGLVALRGALARPDVGCVLLRIVDLGDDVRDVLRRGDVLRLLFEEQGYALYEKAAPANVALANRTSAR